MTKEDSKLIKDAFRLVLTEETKAIDEAITSSPIPSESLYQRCDEKAREIIDEQKKSLPARKILTVLIAATLIISLLVVVTYAARDKIGGFFVDFFEKYVKLSTEHTDPPTASPSDVSVTYIPDAFEETRRDIGRVNGLLEWNKNDAHLILVVKCVTSGSHSIDNENSDYSLIEIGAISLYRTEKNGQISATWTDEKMIYTLSATGVEWDEMVKIIEGIKIEE